MKRTLSFLVLTLGLFVGGAFAQSNANEVFVGYNYTTTNVSTHGITASYTRYVTSGFGLVGEVSAGAGRNDVSLITGMAGAQYKLKRFKYVEPSIKAVAGFARQHRILPGNVNQYSSAFAAGGALDFRLTNSGKVKFRVGADYINTAVKNTRQDGIKAVAGFVF